MIQRLTYLLVLIMIGTSIFAQDTLSAKKVIPEKRHETGLSVMVPFLLLAGVSDNHNERFSFLTYRYRFTERHSLRASVGFAPFYEEYKDNPISLASVAQNTVYSNVYSHNPTNYQVTLGYELMRGKKLKHVFGFELLYNNRFAVDSYYYTEDYITTLPDGTTIRNRRTLDTGSYSKTFNYHKFGANISYSLRYDIGKKWAITASTIASFKMYQQIKTNRTSMVSDFSMVGLISDISMFYKF